MYHGREYRLQNPEVVVSIIQAVPDHIKLIEVELGTVVMRVFITPIITEIPRTRERYWPGNPETTEMNW